MVDRQPTHAGRVRLVPVSGQQNVYDMTMADSPTQAGTPLNKATFLKDSTANLFGLPSSALPDDVFSWIGKFNTHFWRRRTLTLNEVKTDLTNRVEIGRSTSHTIYISNALDMFGNLQNPERYSVYTGISYLNYLVSKAPCYITIDSDQQVYYIPQGATAGETSLSGRYTMYATSSYSYLDANITSNIRAKTVTTEIMYGDWEFIHSINENDYPKTGYLDGYEYEYLGVPFNNISNFPIKMECGNYIGTVPSTTTSQIDATVSLTFLFPPKVLLVFNERGNVCTTSPLMKFGGTVGLSIGNTDSLTTEYQNGFLFALNPPATSGSDYKFMAKKSADGKTISWYTSYYYNSTTWYCNLLNEANKKYYYIAIG